MAKASGRAHLRQSAAGGSGSANVFAFEVTCLKEGNTAITLEVGNRRSGTLQRPMVASSTVEVECGRPDNLELVPVVPQPTGTTNECPLSVRLGGARIPVLCYEDLLIKV